MAEPTKKSKGVNDFLNALSGDNREQAIIRNKCIKPPIGCGGDAEVFRNDASIEEYRVSGLCQSCQDTVFEIGGEA